MLPEAEPFTGSRFEHLAGGGDRQPVANLVTADDLIAVQTLSVRIPARVALDLLEGDLGLRLSELLSRVPFPSTSTWSRPKLRIWTRDRRHTLPGAFSTITPELGG
ncbi:DUF6308 family protein [Streptomyces pseudovenezuelae]|uniref:DUF6308 family protein n=1 Tax=Streptomyces pseudovenezuelae TaxID=67350 RepID=UPI0037207468